ncbi:MAG TPA: hypothetical protein VFG43_04585 [Geminicoccaceae bacterium]|nr:hypothetical protein [Geminicoccaceae bacterium]
MRSSMVVLVLGLAAAPALADRSPYAGQETRAVKALSATEIEELQAGRGMGLALAAELNHYPGPAHVLELADELELSPDQRRATEAVFAGMQAEARALGAAVLEAERALEDVFASGTATPDSVTRITGEIGILQGRLRAVHLLAHVEMKALLTAEQIAHYDLLRGYTGHAPATGPGHEHHHPG